MASKGVKASCDHAPPNKSGASKRRIETAWSSTTALKCKERLMRGENGHSKKTKGRSWGLKRCRLSVEIEEENSWAKAAD